MKKTMSVFVAAAVAASVVSHAAVPNGYLPIDYVECTGAQYIDTGLYPDRTLRVTETLSTTDTAIDKMTFGVRNAGYAFLCWFGKNAGTKISPAIASSGNLSGRNTGKASGEIWTFEMGPDGALADGVAIFSAADFASHRATTAVSSKPLLLFGLSNNGSVDNRKYVGRCYDFKAYTNDLPARDMTPALRVSDNVAGLYDQLSGEFFPSATSTPFVAGPVSKTSLTVEGSPFAIGGVLPSYGVHSRAMTIGEATNIVAPATVAADGVSAVCAGYRLYRWSVEDSDWALESSGAGNSFSFTPGANDAKVVWLWNVVADLAVSMDGAPSAADNAITFPITVGGLGAQGAPANLKLAWGYSADNVACTNAVGTVTAIGPTNAVLPRLQPSTTYYVQAVLATTDGSGGTAASEVVCVQTAPADSLLSPAYIEGDGYAYIDTGYFPTPLTRTVADYQILADVNQNPVFGLQYGNLFYNIYRNGSGLWAYAFQNDKGNWISTGVAVDLKRHVFDFNFRTATGARGFTIDDGLVVNTTLSGSPTKTANYSLWLGATRNGASSYNYICRHRIYSCQMYEGDVLVRDFVPAVQNGAPGLYDFVEGVFHPSASATAYRASPDSEYHAPTARPLTATETTVANAPAVLVSFPSSPDAQTLSAAFGPADAGTTAAAWPLTLELGTIAAGVTNYTYALPADWGSDTNLVVRFYIDGSPAQWSNPVFWRDSSAPSVTDLALDGIGGDTLVVSGTLASFAGANCALTVYTGDSPTTMTNAWIGLPGATMSATGGFSLSLHEPDPASPRYLAPGSTVHAVVQAVSGGSISCSSSATATMEAAPTFYSSSSAVNRRAVTFTGQFFDPGMTGAAVVTLYAGPSTATEADLVAVEPAVTVSDTSPFAITHTFPAVETTYKWQLRAVAASAGATTNLETRTAVASVATLDTTTYTWKTSVTSGNWSDPANWTDNQGGDCLGYPQTAAATALFPLDTDANVVFTEALTVGTVNLSAAGLDITFSQGGASTNATKLTTGTLNLNGARGAVTLDNVAIASSAHITLGERRALSLVNGANLHTTVYLYHQVSNTVLVADNSLLSCDWMYFGGGSLTISNATLWTRGHNYIGANRTGGRVLIAGEHPFWYHAGPSACFCSTLANANAQIDFLVPVGGFATAPIRAVSTEKYYMGNNSDKAGACPLTVNVLDESPANYADATITSPLIDWTKGINKTRILTGHLPVDQGAATDDAFVWGDASDYPKTLSVTINGDSHAGELLVTGAPFNAAVAGLSPGYGYTALAADATRTCTAPAATAAISAVERATCAGWRLYSVNPATLARTLVATGDTASATVTGNGGWLELEWQWNIEYLVTTLSAGNGTVSASEWVLRGGRATISANGAANYGFGRWEGNLGALDATRNPATFPVAGPVTNTAVFYPRVYVSPDGNDANGGTSWDDAKKTIASALASRDTPCVVVSNGSYGVTAQISVSKAAVVESLAGDPSDVVVFRDTGNNIRVFSLNHPRAVLRGISIQGGSLSGNEVKGANVYIQSAGGAVEDCVVRNGSISGWRGTACIQMESASGRLSRCVVTNCASTTTVLGGSALYMTDGLVENCLFAGNRYNTSGAYKGTVVLTGGRLVGCTVAGNTGYVTSGVCAEGSTASVEDCLIGGNRLTQSSVERDAVYYGTAALFSGCLAPFAINGKCLAGELGFLDAPAADYRLSAASAAIDAATGAALAFPCDLGGNTRPSGAACDIGCYEYDASAAHIAIVADATEILVPARVAFAVSATGLSGAASWSWDLDGDGVADATTSTPALTNAFAASGSYPVSVSALDGQGNVLASCDAPVTIRCYPPVVYVDAASATPVAPYETPATAATTLQEALDATIDGATAFVADGSYPLTAAVSLAKAIRVVGNDADPSKVVFYRSKNNVRIFHLNARDAVISGLTMQGGYVSGNQVYGGNLLINRLGGTVTNCIIRGGTATGWADAGGAIYIPTGENNALVTHCVITNNCASTGGYGDAPAGGGAIYQLDGTIRNCLIAGNYQITSDTSSGLFGTVRLSGGLVESCTIVGNRSRYCAGVYATGGTVRNCVIANNTTTVSDSAQHPVWAGTASRFTSCVAPVEINADCLVDAAPLASPDTGDYTLAAASAAIDAAAEAPWMAGAKDLAGNDRIRGTAPDIGAYESDPSAFSASLSAEAASGFVPFDVRFSVTVVNGGGQGYALEWCLEGESTPYATSQMAGETATFTQAFPDPGYYDVVLKVTDNATSASFTVPGHLTVYAAPRTLYVVPAGTEGVASAAPYATWATAATNYVHAVNAALPGAEIVLAPGLHNTPTLCYLEKGVTVRGATGDPADVVIRRPEGSRTMVVNHAQAFVRDISFDNNGKRYSGDGGFAYIYGAGGTFSNCVFRSGYCTSWASKGGAVYMTSAAGVLSHCVFTNLSTQVDNGGTKGVAVHMTNGRMENCLVARNTYRWNSAHTAQDSGGAIYIAGGLVANCTVVTNVYPYCAGVLAAGGTVANTVIAGNSSTILGGDAAVYLGSASRFVNCASDTLALNATCVSGDLAFRDFKAGDYVPLPGSIAINAGDNAYASEATDLLGNPRRYNRRVDVGCFEYALSPTILFLR